MATPTIVELTHDSKDYNTIMEEMVMEELKLWPKHEPFSKSFREDLEKKNYGVLYSQFEGEEVVVVGYVEYTFPSASVASITKIAVKEKYRRQGHGEALLRAAIEKCQRRKIQRICLYVDPLGTSALNLYKKIGFKVDALIEDFYSKDRNAYSMYLDFTDAHM